MDRNRDRLTFYGSRGKGVLKLFQYGKDILSDVESAFGGAGVGTC